MTRYLKARRRELVEKKLDAESIVNIVALTQMTYGSSYFRYMDEINSDISDIDIDIADIRKLKRRY